MIEETIETESQAVASRPWLAPLIAGLVMFVLGLGAGYFGRPLITPEETPVAVAPPPSSGQAGNQEVVAYLVENTRHFKGDPSAPVTIIEFSDFK